MAKIPRVSLGDRPSAVPGGALPAIPGGGVSPVDALGNLVDVGYKIAADVESEQAQKLRQATEAKQAIVNEVSASRNAGDYEENLVSYTDKLKKEFWDSPDKAPEQLLTIGRTLADRQIDAAPNTAVGLDLAQKTASRLDSAMREMHNWAQARQTQKAKNDLSIIINRASAGAEGLGSVDSLAEYIKTKETELSSVFQNVLGSEAAVKMTEMKTGMARAWVLAAGDRDPIAVLTALGTDKGPLVDHLDVSQRNSLRKETASSFEGLTKTRELDVIKRGVADNQNLFDAFSTGAPGLAGAFYAQKQSLDEQRKAIKAQMSLDSMALKKLGIDVQGQTPNEILSVIDEREKFVVALEKARRRQTSFDAPDDPTTVDALLVQQDKALKSKNGKELAEIVRFQTNLAIAVSDKTISGGTASAMFKNMALAMDTASQNAENVWGPNTWRLWRAPLESGNVELNRQFAGQFKKLSKIDQQKVRLNYMGQFNTAQDAGPITVAAARTMALRALALESGEHIPGVE